jgi:prevent-host-death family protein
MIKISMRELTHNLAQYVERAKKGERFVITKQNKEVASLVPKVESSSKKWSMEKPKVKAKGQLASAVVSDLRS